MTDTPAPGKAVATTTAPEDQLEGKLLGTARTPQERAEAFALASAARRSKMLRDVSMALAEKGWGKDVSPVARAAAIRYCFEIGADPARHVFILGGNIFINGTYYREAVAAAPGYLHPDDPIWFHDDPRLTEDARVQRRLLRVEHNIPDDCPACCLLVVHFKDKGPFRGIGRVRAGKTASGKQKDPVGEEFPRESAETRAWREVGEKVVGPWLHTHPRHSTEEIVVEGQVVDEVTATLPPDPTAELQRLNAVVAVQPGASTPTTEGTGGGETEDRGRPSPDPGPAAQPKTVKHQPNAVCGEADYHPRSECKLEAQ